MQVKKSLYVFLSALLGALLFLILHRIIAFAYFISLAYSGYSFFWLSLNEILAIDYVTLVIALLLGGWYGVWLGLYWFGIVYEHSRDGFIGHLVHNFWPSQIANYDLKSKIAVIETKIEKDLDELEDIVDRQSAVSVAPKKRIVRRIK